MQSFLTSGLPYFKADLFTIELPSGGIFRWTTYSKDLTYGLNTFAAFGPAIKRSNWNVKNTAEVPQMRFYVYSNNEDVYLFPMFKLLVHDGLLDGALITLERGILPTEDDTSLGTIVLYMGRVGTTKITALGVDITSTGLNSIMQQYMPRNEYMAGCILALYSPTCTLVESAHTLSTTVGITPAANKIFVPWASPPADPSLYQLGKCVITSGAGSGQQRTIDSASSAGVTLSYPLYVVPAAGDTVNFVQGCNKTQTRCNQFGNIQNRRGFDYIPPAETAF